MKPWKKVIDKIWVKEEEYNSVIDCICENNRKVIIILCAVLGSVLACLIAMGIFQMGIPRTDVPIFFISFIYLVVVFFLVIKNSKKNYKLIMITMYSFIFIAFIYGLAASYRAPQQYTVSFIVLMGIIFMIFVDRPERLAVTNVIATCFCVGMVCRHKTGFVRTADLVNVIAYSILSLIGGYFTVSMKIHGYVMDKKNEQYIAEREQRLVKVESEASQLLAAVAANYDMIVLVNLSQNYYKLIGEESFVTYGDVIEGNFDEVINIHAGKVMEEYRKLYYDTFSRQALLKAHAEGKKEVYLEYQQCDENGISHWLGTHTMFTSDVDSEEVTEITISQNIDSRIQAEEEAKAALEAARQSAEESSRAKSTFLFNTSHDIRTPINAIQGFAKMIMDNADDKDKVLEYAQKIGQSGDTLGTLINDILELSRIEQGKAEAEEQPINMYEHFQNLYEMFEEEMKRAGIQFVTSTELMHPQVLGDNLKLTRIAMNLLSNAKKFTPAGGTILFQLNESEYNGETAIYSICISDTGIGMSKEFQERAFEQFEREKTATESGVTGSGLGLAIIKKLTDLMHGECIIESDLGKGTTVTVSIPLRISDYYEQKVEEIIDYSMFEGKRILLAEDNEFNREIACYLLRDAGFEVDEAENGAIAVDKLMKAKPKYYDVVLMDIQMPVMDGYKATKEIRTIQNPEIANIPIIAMTANAFVEDKERCLAEGMNSHLAKPLDVKVVMAELAKYVV